MPRQSLTPRESEALRAVMEQEVTPLAPEETERAMLALAPHINSAALRLAERKVERRAVRLQAWGLFGASVLFVAVACIVYQNWEFLMAEPIRKGYMIGFGVLALLTVGSLPIVINKDEGVI